MQKDDFIAWLIRWFEQKLFGSEFNLDENFFSAQRLNSFQTLELVMDIESSLKITLPDSALTDTRFQSINGLSDILCELCHAKE